MATKGSRRRRHASQHEPVVDSLLSPEAFFALAHEIRRGILTVKALYVQTVDEGAWPPGGSGTHVTGGSVSKPTEVVFSSGEQRDRRQDCRAAVAWMNKALADVRFAEKALRGDGVEQPETVDPRASITQTAFDRKLHEKRERELRREES